MTAEVLKTYVQLCPKFTPAPPWDFLASDIDAYQTAANPQRVLANLREQFSDEEIIAAGVATLNAERRLRLHPKLGLPGWAFFALRRENGDIYELVLDSGCLRSELSPFVESYGDFTTNEALRSKSTTWGNTIRTVIVTETVADAVLFRALSYASVPAVGLDKLGPAEEVAFRLRHGEWHLTDHDRDLDFEATCPGHAGYPKWAAIVLAEWSPTRLQLGAQEGLSAARERLLALGGYRQWDLRWVGLWQPTADWMQPLQFALDNGSPAWAADLVGDALHRIDLTLEEIARDRCPTPPDEPRSLADLALDLARIRGAPRVYSTLERQQAETAYEEAIQATWVLPLLTASENARDPLERVKFATLAQLVQHASAQASAMQQTPQNFVVGSSRMKEALEGLLKVHATILKILQSTTPSRAEPWR